MGRLEHVNNKEKMARMLERRSGYTRTRWQSKVQYIRVECRESKVEDERRLIRKVAAEKTTVFSVG